jgi:hypothetical protein
MRRRKTKAHLQLGRNDVGVALLRLGVVGAVFVCLGPDGPVLKQRQPLLLYRHVAASFLCRRGSFALLGAQGVIDDGRGEAAGARHGRRRVLVHLRVAEAGRQRLGRALAVRRLLNQARHAQAHERNARQAHRHGETAAGRAGAKSRRAQRRRETRKRMQSARTFAG